jgi:hypothetical protein
MRLKNLHVKTMKLHKGRWEMNWKAAVLGRKTWATSMAAEGNKVPPGTPPSCYWVKKDYLRQMRPHENDTIALHGSVTGEPNAQSGFASTKKEY